MSPALFCKLQTILPQHLLSRIAGYLSNCEQTSIKNWLIRHIMQRYQIDLSYALETDPMQYKSFNAFFTRALAPDARPFTIADDTVLSPADGCLTQYGAYTADQLIQAKGHHFSAIELLGAEFDDLDTFRQGNFATVYLSPRDYHRVHLPMAGTLRAMTHIPGRLFSVNQATSLHIPNLFARNERVACFFETAAGPMAVVFVGAMLVASIVTQWHGVVTPSDQQHIQHWDYFSSEQQHFEQGAEIGHFRFGSTVIVLWPQHTDFNPKFKAGDAIQMGQCLGTTAV